MPIFYVIFNELYFIQNLTVNYKYTNSKIYSKLRHVLNKNAGYNNVQVQAIMLDCNVFLVQQYCSSRCSPLLSYCAYN
jgi:hypothetical protein